MSDLLDLLGDEWALPAEPAPAARGCKHKDRDNVTHGCRESGRTPSSWSDVAGGYVDGMGRRASCSYCPSCIGSGRTSIRDPWTDALIESHGAPCPGCHGTGWIGHKWDCDPAWHAEHWPVRIPEPATAFGVLFDGSIVIAGEGPAERNP